MMSAKLEETSNEFTFNIGLSKKGVASKTPLETKSVTWTKFKKALKKAKPGKKDGPYFIRSGINGQRSDENTQGPGLVIKDADKRIDFKTGQILDGATDINDVHTALIRLGYPHFIYASSSHKTKGDDFHRYRIVFPYLVEDKRTLTAVLIYITEEINERLRKMNSPSGLLVASEENKWSQAWYLPRGTDDWQKEKFAFYEYDDGPIPVEFGLSLDEIKKKYQTEINNQKPILEEVAAKKITQGMSMLSLLAEKLSTPENLTGILTENGYKFKSQTVVMGLPEYRYLAPASTSGMAGVAVFQCKDGRYRVYSHHSADSDPLAEEQGGKQRAHDGLDLIRILEAGNDAAQAMALAESRFTEVELEQLRDKSDEAELRLGQWPHNVGIPWKYFPEVEWSAKSESKAQKPAKLKQTIPNLEFMLKAYGIKVQYNVITKGIEIQGFNGAINEQGDDVENAYITLIDDLATRTGMSCTKIQNQLQAIALKSEYNPVMEYLRGLHWDGVSRIQEFAETMHVPEDMVQARDVAIRRFLIQGIAAADGGQPMNNRKALPKYEYVLVFQSGQGKKKTSFFRAMLPPGLRRYMKDGAWLEPKDKDSVLKCCSHWLTELGELDATFKIADLCVLKAFLSEQEDTIRKPYAKSHGNFKRRTFFCASVNKVSFLADRTGNRRYWTLFIKSLTEPEDAGIDLDQLWAEALRLYDCGEQWWPTPEEEKVLAQSRSRFEQTMNSPIIDRLIGRYGDLSPEAKMERGSKSGLTATDIFTSLNIPFDRGPTRTDLKDIANYLELHNLKADGSPDCKGYSGSRRWTMPLPLENEDSEEIL